MSELNELKQEVAALWSRFRRDEPLPRDEQLRQELVTRLRAQEAARGALADRRDGLRFGLLQHRRRVSRLAPLVRVAGGLAGAGLAAVALLLLPVESLPVVALSPLAGAGVLAGALVLVALGLRRAAR